MNNVNPFGNIKASDYTDDQINSLWVELGPAVIDAIIEPHARTSKFILGGKGSGKTHLLRYHSYPVARRRFSKVSGLSVLLNQKFLAVFLRATGVDASRFEGSVAEPRGWQQLFALYLELRLAEEVLDALLDVKQSSPDEVFDDAAFVSKLAEIISNDAILECSTIEGLISWLINKRREIDHAVNQSAFSGVLDVTIPFNMGSLALGIGRAIGAFHSALSEMPLLYLIDEIENFSELQQEVVNSFIRYGEGVSTFRVTGRLYAIKTHQTIARGERNREGSEFKITHLDEKLRENLTYPKFAKEFVAKHLWFAREITSGGGDAVKSFDPRYCFEEISPGGYYQDFLGKLKFDAESSFIKDFRNVFSTAAELTQFDMGIDELVFKLTNDFPMLLQKLNILIFCKKYKKHKPVAGIADEIRNLCADFMAQPGASKGYYATAYQHYAGDLLAQLCRESKTMARAPYAGFDAFIRMSAGNPRNLLVILGRAYEAAAFREIDFIHKGGLPLALQTSAANEAAHFAFEKDSSGGGWSEQAKLATARLAVLLRTARYALNIPEVSPLAVSFAEEDMSPDSRKIFECAMHNSLIYEIKAGRPDRNSQRMQRKIQLSSMIAPKWGLSLAYRGDLALNPALLNSIFDPAGQEQFDVILKELDRKWNNPFRITVKTRSQRELF